MQCGGPPELRDGEASDQGDSRRGDVAALRRLGRRSDRPLAHYTHQRWSEESDPPRPVSALAQDHRGYLWIASATGLFRFDGMRFEMISAGIDLVTHGAPSAILVRRNGEVWTNFERSRRFAVYREGQLHFLRAPPAPHRVSAMHETRDGTIWVLTEQIGIPLMRFRNGEWTSFGPEAGAPVDNPFSMVVTGDGTVWVSFTGSVARLASDGRRFEFVRHNPGATGRLSIDPQERIWLTERRGTYPITGPGGRGTPPPLRHAYATDAAQIRGWPMFDRDGNLWIATYYDGLQRVARPDPRGAASPAEAAASVERFTVRDGLSSNATTPALPGCGGQCLARHGERPGQVLAGDPALRAAARRPGRVRRPAAPGLGREHLHRRGFDRIPGAARWTPGADPEDAGRAAHPLRSAGRRDLDRDQRQAGRDLAGGTDAPPRAAGAAVFHHL